MLNTFSKIAKSFLLLLYSRNYFTKHHFIILSLTLALSRFIEEVEIRICVFFPCFKLFSQKKNHGI